MVEPSVPQMLEAGLRAASLRQSVITNNIANLDTPGYRRGSVQFEKALADAIGHGSVSDDDMEAQVVHPMTTPVDGNGNDVNLDMEVGELVKNSAMYKTYMRLLAGNYRKMDMAIRGDF